MEKIATLIEAFKNRGANQALYHMKPAYEGHEYVIVSDIDNFAGIETYVFPADEKGRITDWGELPCSFKGGRDHAKALDYAGYKIVHPA